MYVYKICFKKKHQGHTRSPHYYFTKLNFQCSLSGSESHLWTDLWHSMMTQFHHCKRKTLLSTRSNHQSQFSEQEGNEQGNWYRKTLLTCTTKCSNYVTLSNIVPKLHSIEKKNQALKRNSLTSNKDFCVIGEGLHKPSYLIDLPCLFLVR